MARPRLSDPARVTIGLKVSEAEAAQIDQVLARPEFAGWSRSEWCREIIQTALRYYVRKASASGPGQARAAARPAAARPASPSRSPASPAPMSPAPTSPASMSPAPMSPAPASPALSPPAPGPPDPPPRASAPANPGDVDEPGPGAPQPPAQPECVHPPSARDYQTGTCAACGAILWD